MRNKTTLVAITLSLALGYGIWHEMHWDTPKAPQSLQQVTEIFPAKRLPELSFVNQNGQLITTQDLKGKWHLFFMGYSNCPDICPLLLTHMQTVMPQLETYAIDFVFVTADPKRDTPEALRQYLQGYDRQFIGLTSDETTIQSLIQTLGVFVTVNEDGALDHQGVLFIANPEGEIVALLNQPNDPAVIVSDVKQVIQNTSN
jgi:protein SCO1/2